MKPILVLAGNYREFTEWVKEWIPQDKRKYCVFVDDYRKVCGMLPLFIVEIGTFYKHPNAPAIREVCEARLARAETQRA